MNNDMIEQMSENIHYERGYNKGFAEAQEALSKKFEKIVQQETQKAYEKGLREGANKSNNDPCVCGFWGKTHSNKIVSDWHNECLNDGEKEEYMIVDYNRPHGHEKVPTKEKIMLTKDEAYDLNKMLTLNGENKRYIKL